jgi:hypothetical protein
MVSLFYLSLKISDKKYSCQLFILQNRSDLIHLPKDILMSNQIKIPQYPPAKLVKWIEKLRFFLFRIYKKMIPPNIAVLETVQSFWIAKAIGVAAELNIADILKSGPKSISELSAETHTHEDSLYRLMRTLASQGIFKELKNKTFQLTPMANALSEGDNSMKYMIMHQTGPSNWRICGELLESVKTGDSSVRKVLGMEIFENLQLDHAKNELYNKAMTNASEIASAAVVSAYNFSGFRTIADIGGGHGLLLAVILYKHRHLKGIVFDLPHVAGGAGATFAKYDVADRAGIQSGDCFDKVPEGFDAYILKSFIHVWDDEKSISILKNIHKVMSDKGTLLLIEPVLVNDNYPSFGKIFDLQMLVACTGGRERTREEFGLLFTKAGFALNRVIPTVGPFSILEGSKLHYDNGKI